MSIIAAHIDPKLKTRKGTYQEINNSLAEYFFPDTQFAIAEIEENVTTPNDLKLPNMTPEFSSGKKVYFASEEVRDKIYPVMSDGAAYGSLVFTPCKDFKELKDVRILVVDDETGENGGVMPNEEAKRMTGDCYGRMTPDMAEKLTGRTNTPFQFRMGISPQEGNDVYRIAKGTLAPSNKLESLGEPRITKNPDGSTKVKTGYDLVIATSSFKGRKDETKIKPGEYNLTVGIGVKTLAKRSKHSLGTQILVNYPKGVQADILPIVKSQAQKLASIQSDPRKISQYIVEKNEKRAQMSAEKDEALGGFDEVFGTNEEARENKFNNLLKASLEGNPQLLEHPYIVNRLTPLIRNEWLDIATGRSIEFQSALAQPSLDLKEDEVCVPNIPEGEKLIVTRSPLINSNGVITLTNKHLPEFASEKGTIHIHPKTAAAYLQADFDGDRLAYELSSKYPTLAAEIEVGQRPENRHADVIKATKIPYQANSFAEVAISASQNDIGTIANQIQKAVAIYNEIDNLPPEKVAGFTKKLTAKARLIANQDISKIPDEKKQQAESLKSSAIGIVENADNPQEVLKLGKNLLFETVNLLSNELQTAADGPKSAARPNESILEFADTALKARDVAWISAKKNPNTFLNEPLKSENFSPIDALAQAVNQQWQENHLEMMPTDQFRNLFPKEFSPEILEEAQEIIKTYKALYREAVELEERSKTESNYHLSVTSSTSGKSITLTDISKFNHPEVWTRETLDIRLMRNEGKLVGAAQTQEGKWETVGTVAPESIKEHGLKERMTLFNAKTELKPGITQSEIDAKFARANDFADQIRNQNPDGSRYNGGNPRNALPQKAKALQSAIWDAAHASRQKGYQNYSRASTAFNIFSEQVAERVKEFQFKELTLAGVHHPTNEWGDKLNNKTVNPERSRRVNFEIALETRKGHPNINKRVVIVEGKQVAPISEFDYHPPIGTTGKATITPAPSTSCSATTAKGNTLKITQLRKHDFGGIEFSSSPATLTIAFETSTSLSFNGKKPVAKIGEKTLGVIDKESCEKLQKAGIYKSGTELQVTLQNNLASTATLHIDKDSLKFPETWNKEAPALPSDRQATDGLALSGAEGLNKENLEAKPYERPEWETKLTKSALRELNDIPPSSLGNRITVLLGEYIAVYNDKEKCLKIHDVERDRGVIYQATRGKPPEVEKFTLQEKLQFQNLELKLRLRSASTNNELA
ncbi:MULTISPECIES: hypothetical protein [unclassified Coleofasciculus]|uniref:hypothetical protein n=1 Tax=unclassified Coleofasciculus TaxID=2692782 RepID=UPI00187FFEE5|nr:MULTISPECIES: hypothetical protein [unclassified Coleofasciculus]MBE9128707.1 hypothetical protein [Coleofasciculus sp. LEGE 07081]MBE9149878.1 hypothetical protein [Coleofasciculus sp. LEGE 07092]